MVEAEDNQSRFLSDKHVPGLFMRLIVYSHEGRT
jgi:hypothetical protein